MTTKQIRYFLAAYEQQNIAKAAELLFVSRPVISRALSDLENEFGFSLFLRTGNGISPTEQGQEIYNLLKACQSSVEETVARLRDSYSRRANHQVTLGVLNASGSWHYRQIISPFMQQHPDISVSVVGLQAEDTMRVMADGTVDLAIAPILLDQGITPRIIHRQPLYDVEFVLCIPPGAHMERRSITVEECSRLPVAVYENLPPPLFAQNNLVLSTRKLDIVYMAVSQGYAYSVLPTELTAEHPELRTIPFNPAIKVQTYLLWNDLLPHGKAFSVLRSFICDMDLQPLRERFAQAYRNPGEMAR